MNNPIWSVLTTFWLHHDIFFATHFPLYAPWVRWNEHHFRHLHHIHQWFRTNGQALWAWCNING